MLVYNAPVVCVSIILFDRVASRDQVLLHLNITSGPGGYKTHYVTQHAFETPHQIGQV